MFLLNSFGIRENGSWLACSSDPLSVLERTTLRIFIFEGGGVSWKKKKLGK